MIRIKKVIAIMLVGIMILGTSITTFAAEGNIKADNIESVLSELNLSEGLIIPRAPAPPITQMNVRWVNSENAGAETIANNQYTTQLDHGGSWVQVITFELGYSSRNIATFDGIQMERLDSEPVDVDGDRIVDGFLYLWSVDTTFSSGRFVSSATSANSPWNTMETWIQVR